MGPCPYYAGEIREPCFISTVRPAALTNTSRKRSFSKTLYKTEVWSKMTTLRSPCDFSAIGFLKHELTTDCCVFSAVFWTGPDSDLQDGFCVSIIIAVFNNMRTLKFKPQLTVYVFRCRQSSKRISWETEAHFSRVKRSRLLVVIGGFRSILFGSVF